MRCLIVSDIHANLAAFEAVLQDVKERSTSFDTVWCLGDLVGYGPDPNDCIDLLRTLPHVCLAGNHDWAVVERLDLSTFHESAAAAVLWTREALSSPNLNYLRARSMCLELDDYYLVHASPREPIWEYITDMYVAEENFGCVATGCCLVGHTHVPILFVKDGRTGHVRPASATSGASVVLRKDSRYLINPGSVGQPRDGDPRAAYALLDTTAGTWTQLRVPYNVEATQQKMRLAKLPARLIERLEYGR